MNKQSKPRRKRAEARSPFLERENWRAFMESVFDRPDKRDDADLLAQNIYFAREAVREVESVLSNLIIDLKKFGRFPQIEMKFYDSFLRGELEPEQEVRFRGLEPGSGAGTGARVGAIRKKAELRAGKKKDVRD
jgi:hypothetical protein